VQDPTTPPNVVTVVAAIIERDGQFLLTRRLDGTHLAGLWEFPGGKCDAGESHEDCLRREIREELGAGLRPGRLVLATTHAYPERTVALYFYEAELTEEPHPILGQEMRWVARDELEALDFPEADAALIELLVGHGALEGHENTKTENTKI
jgi:8-oxo-dGTP diphosphatase